MAVPKDKPGSPMDWFNKNADKLKKKYGDEWVVISGKGVELHGSDSTKLQGEMDKLPQEARDTWVVAFIPKYPRI